MYAELVNGFRIACPDGTFREPTPSEVKSAVKSCSYVSLNGHPKKSWPALRDAERNGYLSDAIHLRRITAEAVEIIITY